MTNWDKKFLRKLKNHGLKTNMYARYVDDIVASVNTINKGWSYDNIRNRMTFSKEN